MTFGGFSPTIPLSPGRSLTEYELHEVTKSKISRHIKNVFITFHSLTLKNEGKANKLQTQAERIGAVSFGVCVLMILMAIFRQFFSKSFFRGFTVATGLFLSFDIVVFHWIFQLHRITNGSEANWLEPILVMAGTTFVGYGVIKENSDNKSRTEFTVTL
ncbi:hypothetical protein [Cohnella sp.]|uniref:hypothetical protein n=1 Tax=Cohnella sp. TaxID=1883426 RepID=UPI003564527E